MCGVWAVYDKISVPSFQFCCELKTAQQRKIDTGRNGQGFIIRIKKPEIKRRIADNDSFVKLHKEVEKCKKVTSSSIMIILFSYFPKFSKYSIFMVKC